MIEPLSAFILGLVEGFTEFLPISSTAHLILTSHILGISQSGFTKTFEIAIQGGAILAVLVFFWRRFLDIKVVGRIVLAFIPTGIIGLIVYPFAKNYLLGNLSVVLWAMALGGIVLIMFEYFLKKGLRRDGISSPNTTDVHEDIRDVGYGKIVVVGIAQAVAIIPGVSRSAATIIGGMLCGISKIAIVEFSFLLAVPTILAAAGFDLVKNSHTFSVNDIGMLALGFVVSFVAAVCAIKFLLSFVHRHSFVAFGVYRIALALIFFALLV